MKTILFDPEAPGRGPNPRWLGHMYRWERVDDFPIVGRFAGVLLGTTKGADTLIVSIQCGGCHGEGLNRGSYNDCEECDGSGRAGYIQIRYEHLISAIRVREAG